MQENRFETRVVFLRHGLSCANMEVPSADPSLCPLFPVHFVGPRASVLWSSAEEWLVEHGWCGQVLYCSRLPRAIMTAQLLARQARRGKKVEMCRVVVVPGLEEEVWQEPASEKERVEYANLKHSPQWVDPRLTGDPALITQFVRAAWMALAEASLLSGLEREYRSLAEHAEHLEFCPEPHKKHRNSFRSALACIKEREKQEGRTRGLVSVVSHGNFLHNYLVQTDRRCPQDPLHNLEIVRKTPTGRVRRFRFNSDDQAAKSMQTTSQQEESSEVDVEVWKECILDPEVYCKQLVPLWKKAEHECAALEVKEEKAKLGGLHLHRQAGLCPEHRLLASSELREAQNEHFTAAYLGHTTWSYFHFFAASLVREEDEVVAMCSSVKKEEAQQKRAALIASFSRVVLHWLHHYPCGTCRQNFLSDKSLVRWLRSALSRCREPRELHRILVDLHNQINKQVAAQREPPEVPLVLTYEEAQKMWEF